MLFERDLILVDLEGIYDNDSKKITLLKIRVMGLKDHLDLCENQCNQRALFFTQISLMSAD